MLKVSFRRSRAAGGRLATKSAFTLIELIVVIAIIAVLGAVVTPNIYRAVTKAQIVKTVADMKAIKSALLVYRADTGVWPDPFYFRCPGYGHRNVVNGAAYSFDSPPLISNVLNAAGWDGPYIERVLRSPLIREYAGSGFTYPGIYWIGGTVNYAMGFDLDGDGNVDVNNAVSVQLAGLNRELSLAVDKVFDGGEGVNGMSGLMNVYEWTHYCYVYYCVSTGE